MRISATEEYGLRCLLHLAREKSGTLTLQDVATREGLSVANVAKLLGQLRRAGLVASIRGAEGGYRLARPATDVRVSHVLDAMGGAFFTTATCEKYPGGADSCVHLGDCSIRSVWARAEAAAHAVLESTSLADLLTSEVHMNETLAGRFPAGHEPVRPALVSTIRMPKLEDAQKRSLRAAASRPSRRKRAVHA